MTGDRDRPQSLSLAHTTLHCTADAGEVGALPVGFSDNLTIRSLQGHHADFDIYRQKRCRNWGAASLLQCAGCSVPAQRRCITMLRSFCTAAGVQAYALPAGLNDSLLYFQQANISFQGAQVLDMYAGSLDNIIAFNSCTHLNLTNFVSTGCQAQSQIVNVTNSSNVYVLNSSFRNASARGLSITNSTSELDGNVYENLSTAGAAGALYVDNSGGNKVSVKRSNFSSNYAEKEGGAIYMNVHNCYFEDNRFIHNSNWGHGGAVLIHLADATVTFRNSFFANNTAGASGAVYAYPSEGSIGFYNCTFVGNLGYQGGAVSLWGVANGVIDNCTFEGNSVRYDGHPGNGPALYVDGYSARSTALYILNSTFYNNDGSSCPGSGTVLASECNCLGIMGSKFENNSGIGLIVGSTQGNCEKSDLPYPPLFNLSTIAGNADSYLNQYMHDTVLGASTSVDIRSTTFKGNVDSTFLQGIETEAVATALKGGAGLSIVSTQRIMLVDLHFDGNKAWQGGALLLDSCFATVIWSCTFTHNLATQGGGAVASVNNLHLGGLFIGNTSATGNKAFTGGAVYGADQASITIGNGTVFDGNEVSTDGGAVACLECVSVTFQDQVAMQMNHAAAAGGALHVDSSSAIQSTNTTYYGNRCDRWLPDMYLDLVLI